MAHTIEKNYSSYIIHGESADGARVDLADCDGDIGNMARAAAERLIRDRDQMLRLLVNAYEYIRELGGDPYEALIVDELIRPCCEADPSVPAAPSGPTRGESEP